MGVFIAKKSILCFFGVIKSHSNNLLVMLNYNKSVSIATLLYWIPDYINVCIKNDDNIRTTPHTTIAKTTENARNRKPSNEKARNGEKKQEKAFRENKHTEPYDATDPDLVYLAISKKTICLTKKRNKKCLTTFEQVQTNHKILILRSKYLLYHNT